MTDHIKKTSKTLSSVLVLFVTLSDPGIAQVFDGSWCGTTDQGKEASFSVEDDTIVHASFAAEGSNPVCSLEVTISGSLSEPIVDSAFTFALNGIYSQMTIDGMFPSTASASGTLDLIDTLCGITVSTTWSATPGVCSPRIRLDTLQRNFGEVDVGTSTPTRRVVITNDGTRLLRIDPILVRGTDRTQFTLPEAQDRCSLERLAPEESCQFRVGFQPSGPGPKRALVVIGSNDPIDDEVRVQLIGTGVGRAVTGIEVDPLVRNYGDVAVGTTAATRQVTITNGGEQRLDIDPILIRGVNRSQFTLPAAQDQCSQQTLAPSASCRFRVGFAPTAAGMQRALAIVRSNDPGQGEIRVQLRGNGVPAVLAKARPVRDLALVNGNVMTMDEYDRVVSAVRIRDGRFVAVGDEVGELDETVEVIDLGGRTVIPGLVDTGALWQSLVEDPAALSYAHSMGLTTFVDPASGPDLTIKTRLRYRRGAVSSRIASELSASELSAFDPWLSIYGLVAGEAGADEGVDRLEALRLYTTDSGWIDRGSEDVGSIEAGRPADLVVLSADYLGIPESEIKTLSSVLTLVAGEVVHASAEFTDRWDAP